MDRPLPAIFTVRQAPGGKIWVISRSEDPVARELAYQPVPAAIRRQSGFRRRLHLGIARARSGDGKSGDDGR